MRSAGYGSCPVCLYMCLCVSACPHFSLWTGASSRQIEDTSGTSRIYALKFNGVFPRTAGLEN